MPFPVDHSQRQTLHSLCFGMARHRAEWGTHAGYCLGMGGEETMPHTGITMTN